MNGKKLYLRIGILAVLLTVIAASNRPAQAFTEGCVTDYSVCFGDDFPNGQQGFCQYGNCNCQLPDNTVFYAPIYCSAPIQ
jgi:hypothetical protein